MPLQFCSEVEAAKYFGGRPEVCLKIVDLDPDVHHGVPIGECPSRNGKVKVQNT